MTIVMKFGGTSVGTGERIANVARIASRVLTDTTKPPVVVVSAMSGVTDSLRRAAYSAADHDGETFRLIRDELQLRHQQAIADCVEDEDHARALRAEISGLLDWFEMLCQSIYTLGELTPRGQDVVWGLGERLSARVVSAAMRSQGLAATTVEATDVLVTDDNFTSANPLFEETEARAQRVLQPLLDAGTIPVVTGFVGATKTGVPTTLGRGSSDFTATILGRCLKSDEVWIWTDVNGVMTADPRIVENARTLETIAYAEVAELSYFGAKVLHPRTIQPVSEMNIPVRVLNSMEPEHPGTIITNEVVTTPVIKGITAIRDLSLITVSGRGMQGVPGVAGRVFTAISHAGASALLITQSSSEQGICFAVQATEAERAVAALESELELERMRGVIDSISRRDDVSIIAVVGAGMLGQPGIAWKVFGALSDQQINIISIAQGSSEYNLSLVVDRNDVDAGVRAIHQQFEL